MKLNIWLPVLSTFAALSGTAALARPLECTTPLSRGAQYSLRVENADIPLGGKTRAILTKLIFGNPAGARNLIVTSAPTPRNEYVFATPILVAVITRRPDNRGLMQGRITFSVGDQPIPAMCSYSAN